MKYLIVGEYVRETDIIERPSLDQAHSVGTLRYGEYRYTIYEVTKVIKPKTSSYWHEEKV